MSKLQEKLSALKREHPAIQKMKFINFFLCLWVIFALLGPDPDCESGSGYGSRDPIESGSGYGRYLPITGAEDREGGMEERPARTRGQALEYVMQHHVCQSAAKFPKSCSLKDKRTFSIFFFKMTYRFPAVLFQMWYRYLFY
jgi:hypothetical protein